MKRKILCLLLVFVLCLSGCGGGDPLGAIKGANNTQRAAIQDVLDECGIAVQSCSEATIDETDDELANSVVSAMLTNFSPYDITDVDGNVYRMVIKKEDYSVFIINNSEGETVYGGLSGLFG